MKRVTVGIDPSVNSTGICVSGVDEIFNIYYIVSSKSTKKSITWVKDKDWINIEEYEKISTTDIEKYHQKEFVKFGNLFVLVETISCVLEVIMSQYIIDYVTMEGVSYGSVKGSALVDLAFLNAMIRMKLHDKKIKFYIVAPTEVKKYAVGNGSAEKSVMMMSWKKLDLNANYLPEWFKCDDLADAYFMAHYNPEYSE